MTWGLISSAKSGKREVALSLLMFWAFVSGYVLFWLPSETVKDYADIWDTLTWATFAWSAAAFGIDFVMKTKAAPVPQRRRREDGPETVRGAA